MRGYRTWLAIAGLIISAANDAFVGEVPDYQSAVTKITMALGLFGIGHKIEKSR